MTQILDQFISEDGKVYQLEKVQNGVYHIRADKDILSEHAIRYVAEERFRELRGNYEEQI